MDCGLCTEAEDDATRDAGAVAVAVAGVDDTVEVRAVVGGPEPPIAGGP